MIGRIQSSNSRKTIRIINFWAKTHNNPLLYFAYKKSFTVPKFPTKQLLNYNDKNFSTSISPLCTTNSQLSNPLGSKRPTFKFLYPAFSARNFCVLCFVLRCRREHVFQQGFAYGVCVRAITSEDEYQSSRTNETVRVWNQFNPPTSTCKFCLTFGKHRADVKNGILTDISRTNEKKLFKKKKRCSSWNSPGWRYLVSRMFLCKQ